MISLFAGIAGLFGNNRVVDGGMKIIEHLTGADGMTGKEKADFILKWQAATAHQSPARRFIAVTVTLVWALTVVAYLSFIVLSKWFVLEDQVVWLSGFIKDTIKEPFNIVIMFYFTVQGITAAVDKFKK